MRPQIIQNIAKMRSQTVKNIVHPISKENIFPCLKHFCVCVEYLNFTVKKDVEWYKQCMITDLKVCRPHKK